MTTLDPNLEARCQACPIRCREEEEAARLGIGASDVQDQIDELVKWIAEDAHKSPLEALRSIVIQQTGITQDEVNLIVAKRLGVRT